ncbi:3-deoxy-7-phosphoheptulonate synthase [Candidatus Protofrankia californiensis]|nr:3-deoxy-7-phosphoheptulonate synthase [Candidatus Protofrankia californiensis]
MLALLADSRKTEAVRDEVRGFVELHWALGSHPGGVHAELAGSGAGLTHG